MAHAPRIACTAATCLVLAGPASPLVAEALADDGYCVDLTVEGVRNSEGLLLVALFDDEPAYLEDRDQARDEQIPATEGTVSHTVCGLPEGRYVLSLFHDENEDSALDTNWVGIPKEGYGFSGGAKGLTGKPAFDKIAFELSASTPRHAETVRMTYWF